MVPTATPLGAATDGANARQQENRERNAHCAQWVSPRVPISHGKNRR
jgi:hypothetical protein